MIFALIPLSTWLVTVIVVRRYLFDSPPVEDLIRAVLLASVAWGVYLVVVTEALSLMTALSFGPLVACWAIPIPLMLWSLRAKGSSTARWERPKLTSMQTVLLALVLVIVVGTGIVAWASAPNTWDSMTYHLPRVMHWEQNQSVAHYATHEPRQLYMSPWAEMVATHFQILSGGDRFANLIQWFSMVGSLLAIFLLAGRFGAGLDGQALSMLAAATIPMGLLQAISTQTDHVVAFHMLTAVYFLSTAETSGDWPRVLAAAAATGLAAITKATAYLFLAPFLVWFACRLLVARRRAALLPLVIFGTTVIALNFGHYLRNFELFESPLKPVGLGPYHQYSNEIQGPKVAISNVTRSAAVHLTLPAPGFVTASFESVRRLHSLLGIDPEDPRTTWPGMRFQPAPVLVHEDFSGNFVHGLLILGALAAVGFSRRLRRGSPRLALHAAQVTLGFLLFASYLKWAPWHARLHLSLFLLFTPMVGVLIGRLPKPLVLMLAGVMFAQTLPFAFSNPLHPVQGDRSVLSAPRLEQYFYPRPRLGAFYRDVAEQVTATGCGEVGLSMPPDSWEYPLWVVLDRVSSKPFRLATLEADNPSRVLLDATFEPCAVVCIRCAPDRRQRIVARLGEPVISTPDDLQYTDDNMLFLQ